MVKKINTDDKSKIESDLKDLKEAVEKNDLDAMKQKTQDLTQSSMKMGEAMYKDQQAAGAEQPQADPKQESSKDDDVIDADYEEVDEDKKASGQ
jgi:molecular chaperone DnaK